MFFFHATNSINYESIVERGFLSAKELNSGELESVSYSKRSSGCFANLGCHIKDNLVIFAVRFTDEDLRLISEAGSDIHVYRSSVQPELLGYVAIPSGLKIT